MHEMYEGLRAVCAVLRDLEPCMPKAPALRLAERHLHLLARLAAGQVEGARGEGGGDGGGPGALTQGLPIPPEASHVVQ